MNFSKEEEYLRQKDKKLKKIINKNGPILFKPLKKYQFHTLVEIVVSQFISTAAANSIFNNIKRFFNTKYLNESHFQNMEVDKIKKLGISTNKAKTIKELSNLFLNKNIEDLTKLEDDILHEKLLSIFGIGPWSVNMFEIFCIGKLDVFTSKDAGLRLAMNKAKLVSSGSDWENYDYYAKKWSPYRSVACLHLWKTVD